MRKRSQRAEPSTPLAERIDAAIERAGLTNEAVAEPLGVTAGNVSHWRVGRHAPDVEMVQRLARVLGASDYTLLTGQPDPRAILAALQPALAGFRSAVLEGEDPAAAWERILGQTGLLSEDERAIMRADPAELRAYLASVDGVEWVALTEEQHRLLRDLVQLFSRYREGAAADTERGPAPPPAETSG